jgi:hypothetical protein
MVLKAHLHWCTPEVREALLRFLPDKERQYLANLPNAQEDNLPEEISVLQGIEKVHWSWFLPTIKAFSEREQRLFLAVLEPYAAEQIKTLLSLQGPVEEITETAKAFLREQLVCSLVPTREGILPVNYLPPSPLNHLLSLSKKQLIHLIDSLALYDLAQEVRQIVETKILKKLYSLLSEEQKYLLKHITPHREFNVLPKLGIDKWDGTEESLKIIIHRRGIARLGLALAGQNMDLIWMLCHQLDIGRGGTLFRLCEKEKRSSAADTVQRQIEELLSLL